MTYLYVYLAIGVVTLIAVLVAHLASRTSEVIDIAELLLAVDPNSNKWWWKPLNKIVIPLLAGIFIVLVWPAALVMKVKDILKERAGMHTTEDTELEPPKKEFLVDREALIQQLSLEEVEAAETIADPLEGAPRLPFGHLNKAWNEFTSHLEDGELWMFSAQWTSDWGRKEKQEGYVIVRGNEIGPYFLTKWLPLGEAG